MTEIEIFEQNAVNAAINYQWQDAIKFNKKILVKNIYLFKDLSDNYSIADQVFLAQNAYGYFGNGYGAMIFFDILVKKILLIDYVWDGTNNLCKKNRLHLYKKIINKKNMRVEICNLFKTYNNKDHKILENTYGEIYNNFKIKFKYFSNFLLNKKYLYPCKN